MGKDIAVAAFDYSDFEADDKGKLIYFEAQIRKAGSAHVKAIIDVGEQLAGAQKILADYNGGVFVKWLGQFGLSKSTAYNYIHAFETFGSFPTVGKLTPTAIYLLSAPKAPDAAVREAKKLADKGIVVNDAVAKGLIGKHTVEPDEEDEDDVTVSVTPAPADEPEPVAEPGAPAAPVSEDDPNWKPEGMVRLEAEREAAREEPVATPPKVGRDEFNPAVHEAEANAQKNGETAPPIGGQLKVSKSERNTRLEKIRQKLKGIAKDAYEIGANPAAWVRAWEVLKEETERWMRA